MYRGAAILLALIASGCAYHPGGPQTLSLVEEVAPARALVMPPPGGPRIVTVIESRYVDALQQRIVLANDTGTSGSNYIETTFFGPAGNANVPSGRSLGYQTTTMVDIQREIRAAFPGVRMLVSPYYAQNSYGPFGYAVGRSGGADCLFGWQQIERRPNINGERERLGRVTIRVRLCRTGADEATLVRFMYGIVVSGTYLSPGWDPFEVPEPDPRIGATGQPILPGPAGSNPYYLPDPAEARSPKLLPRRPAAPARAATGTTARPTAVLVAPEPAAAVLDPPLGVPGALPRPPGATRAEEEAAPAPAAPAAPSYTPKVPPVSTVEPEIVPSAAGAASAPPVLRSTTTSAAPAAPASPATTLAPIVPPAPAAGAAAVPRSTVLPADGAAAGTPQLWPAPSNPVQ